MISTSCPEAEDVDPSRLLLRTGHVLKNSIYGYQLEYARERERKPDEGSNQVEIQWLQLKSAIPHKLYQIHQQMSRANPLLLTSNNSVSTRFLYVDGSYTHGFIKISLLLGNHIPQERQLHNFEILATYLDTYFPLRDWLFSSFDMIHFPNFSGPIGVLPRIHFITMIWVRCLLSLIDNLIMVVDKHELMTCLFSLPERINMLVKAVI